MESIQNILNQAVKCQGEYITPWNQQNQNNFLLNNRIESFIEKCYSNMNLTIVYNNKDAQYYPYLDRIDLPFWYYFKNASEYYRIIFHELSHGVGNNNRQNRYYYDEDPIEELVAELSAYQLIRYFDINNKFTIHNSLLYCQNWMQDLLENYNQIENIIKHIDKDVKNNINYLLRIGEDKIYD